MNQICNSKRNALELYHALLAPVWSVNKKGKVWARVFISFIYFFLFLFFFSIFHVYSALSERRQARRWGTGHFLPKLLSILHRCWTTRTALQHLFCACSCLDLCIKCKDEQQRKEQQSGWSAWRFWRSLDGQDSTKQDGSYSKVNFGRTKRLFILLLLILTEKKNVLYLHV